MSFVAPWQGTSAYPPMCFTILFAAWFGVRLRPLWKTFAQDSGSGANARPLIKRKGEGMLHSPLNIPTTDHVGHKPPDAAGSTAQPGLLTLPQTVSAEDFVASYGEPLERTLNLDTWERSEDLNRLFARLDEEISQALDQEDELHRQIREIVFPQIAQRPHAPPE